MKQPRVSTILAALAACGAAGGCSSSIDSGSNGRQGSRTGVDGGDLDAEASSSSNGGSGSGNQGKSGQGGAAAVGGSAGGARAAGGATAAGGTTATAVAHASGPVTSVAPVGSAAVCSTQSVNAAAGILDIFIMLDRSESMAEASAGGTKWDVITQALESFLTDPQSATMSAGISFFGIPVAGSGGFRGGVADSSCTAADYAAPVVPIAVLGAPTGNAAKITAAIQAESPATNTPTEPALQGAIDYASAWAKQHPTHKVIVVFATDGLPNGCNSTVAGAAKIAAAGVAANPSTPTYVIGVFGDQDCPGGVAQGQACPVVSNTNQIAKGGGTGSAFIVNATAGTGAQFLSALNAIRSANQVGCSFKVPAPAKGKVIDFSRATVSYTSGKGTTAAVTWRTGAAQCGTAGGWYYNSDAAPNQVLLCDASCKTVMADPGAKISVTLACEPPATTGAGGAGNGVGGGASSGSGGASSGAGGAGSGKGGAGSGGTSSGTGGTGAGGKSCLLVGQSCAAAADCCGGMCVDGVCAAVIR